jgi:hypothetical protein
MRASAVAGGGGRTVGNGSGRASDSDRAVTPKGRQGCLADAERAP